MKSIFAFRNRYLFLFVFNWQRKLREMKCGFWKMPDWKWWSKQHYSVTEPLLITKVIRPKENEWHSRYCACVCVCLCELKAYFSNWWRGLYLMLSSLSKPCGGGRVLFHVPDLGSKPRLFVIVSLAKWTSRSWFFCVKVATKKEEMGWERETTVVESSRHEEQKKRGGGRSTNTPILFLPPPCLFSFNLFLRHDVRRYIPHDQYQRKFARRWCSPHLSWGWCYPTFCGGALQPASLETKKTNVAKRSRNHKTV